MRWSVVVCGRCLLAGMALVIFKACYKCRINGVRAIAPALSRRRWWPTWPIYLLVTT